MTSSSCIVTASLFLYYTKIKHFFLTIGVFIWLKQTLEQIFQLFPVLEQRTNQVSGTLSGGEQQMLAIGRALMSQPKLLCIDEPSTGLAPIVRGEVFNTIERIYSSGIPVLLVEQEVSTVFQMATRNYVLSSGRVVGHGTGDEFLKDDVIRKTYLGL